MAGHVGRHRSCHWMYLTNSVHEKDAAQTCALSLSDSMWYTLWTMVYGLIREYELFRTKPRGLHVGSTAEESTVGAIDGVFGKL